jgi:hypothetical protein
MSNCDQNFGGGLNGNCNNRNVCILNGNTYPGSKCMAE